MNIENWSEVRVIQDAIFCVMNLTIEELRGRGRGRVVSDGRSILVHLVRKRHPTITLDMLGEHIGRNHATVYHYYRRHNGLYKHNKAYRDVADSVVAVMNEMLETQRVDRFDGFAIFRPNGSLVEKSIQPSIPMAWFTIPTMGDDVSFYESNGWECRPVQVTVSSTKYQTKT